MRYTNNYFNKRLYYRPVFIKAKLYAQIKLQMKIVDILKV